MRNVVNHNYFCLDIKKVNKELGESVNDDRDDYLSGYDMTRIQSWDFQGFLFDVPNGRLLNNGKNVNLSPKAFEVLRHLVEHNGGLLTKEQLLEGVWKNRVGAGVLKGKINEIRRALGDNAREPQYIETIQRRGYRFIAEAKRKESEISPDKPAFIKVDPSPDDTSASSNGFPCLIGEWKLTVECQHRSYTEHMHIDSQDNEVFCGRLLTSSLRNTPSVIEQVLHGRFLDIHHAVYTYHSKTNAMAEWGTGTFVISALPGKISGKAIRVGSAANAPTLLTFTADLSR